MMKQQTKRAFLLLLAALLGAQLCGCGGNTHNASQDGDTSVPDTSTGTEAASTETTDYTSALALWEAVLPETSAYPSQEDYLDAEQNYDWEGYEAAYEAWEADYLALRENLPEAYSAGLDAFAAETLAAFLTTEGSENLVYSPLNVYLALSMLAEVTDGGSRAQLLELLGADSVETLRANAAALWKVNYRDDGAVTSMLANSLWLNDSVSYNSATLETLAENYYASTYQGEMGSDALNLALQQWLNENTGNLLSQQAGSIGTEPSTVLALASTIYYKAGWDSAFSSSANTEGTFYGPDGEINCTFMNQSDEGVYYWGDHFSAVRRGFSNSGSMWLVLPDEDTAVTDLLSDDQVMELLSGASENRKQLTIHLSMPKFDASSSYDLIDGLRSLGVTDVFDSSVSDFTPLTGDTDSLEVSQALHAARVTVDEEGCEAAVFTVISVEATAMEPEDLEEIDFVLDRPFLFFITSEEGQLLFAGVVNTPAA